MKIVADENISFVREAFGQFGEVEALNASEIDHQLVLDADVLLVRSVTNVGPELLEGSPVRFVGTATIGVDHIDQNWLEDSGIGFASAPGTSAKTVAEYVTSALLYVSSQTGKHLQGSSLAVTGAGNVGSISARYGTALGMNVMLNDPPLARSSGDTVYRPLHEVTGADFMTLHVPLTREGDDATYHMFDSGRLAQMADGATLINSARGPVVDNAALKEELETGRLHAVLDVWEGEPAIDVSLAERTLLGTPHIAGYSQDAKLNGTRAIYAAACKFFGEQPVWTGEGCLPPAPVPELTIDGQGRDREDVVREAVHSVYDIHADFERLKEIFSQPKESRGSYFANLRTSYPLRREFTNTMVRLRNCPAGTSDILDTLGFRTEKEK